MITWRRNATSNPQVRRGVGNFGNFGNFHPNLSRGAISLAVVPQERGHARRLLLRGCCCAWCSLHLHRSSNAAIHETRSRSNLASHRPCQWLSSLNAFARAIEITVTSYTVDFREESIAGKMQTRSWSKGGQQPPRNCLFPPSGDAPLPQDYSGKRLRGADGDGRDRTGPTTLAALDAFGTTRSCGMSYTIVHTYT